VNPQAVMRALARPRALRESMEAPALALEEKWLDEANDLAEQGQDRRALYVAGWSRTAHWIARDVVAP
jgi:hypothetical protein